METETFLDFKGDKGHLLPAQEQFLLDFSRHMSKYVEDNPQGSAGELMFMLEEILMKTQIAQEMLDVTGEIRTNG